MEFKGVLDVSVDDVFGMKVLEPKKDVSKHDENVTLGNQCFVFLHKCLQSAASAVFHLNIKHNVVFRCFADSGAF